MRGRPPRLKPEALHPVGLRRLWTACIVDAVVTKDFEWLSSDASDLAFRGAALSREKFLRGLSTVQKRRAIVEAAA